MGDLDEPNTTLDQSSGKQAALTKLASVGFPQRSRFTGQFESAHELWSCQFKAVLQGGIIILDATVLRITTNVSLAENAEQFLPAFPTRGHDIRRSGEASGTDLRCSTRRNGGFRCTGRDFAAGQEVHVTCQ